MRRTKFVAATSTARTRRRWSRGLALRPEHAAFPAALAVLVVTPPLRALARHPRRGRRRVDETRPPWPTGHASRRRAGKAGRHRHQACSTKQGTLTAAGRRSIAGHDDARPAQRTRSTHSQSRQRSNGSSSHPIAALFARHDQPEIGRPAGRSPGDADGRGMEARLSGRSVQSDARGAEAELAGARWRHRPSRLRLELAAAGRQRRGSRHLPRQRERPRRAIRTRRDPEASKPPRRLSTFGTLGIEPIIASGDRGEAVDAARLALRVERASARLEPAGKLNRFDSCRRKAGACWRSATG